MMLLRDVKDHPKRKVNLIGIVVEFSIPRMSEGTVFADYCTILKVIDRSQQSPELSVNVFIYDVHQLPHIRSRRDIILLSCVRSVSNFSSILPPHSDKPFIASLRNWCLTFQLDSGISPYAVSLNEIKEREFVDLVCKEPNGEAVAVWSCAHVSNFITVLTLTDYESTKFSTLMDLLTFSKVTCATLEDRTARIYMLYCVVKMR
ncbi:hypothetical protein RHMOL_Rhmol02G0000300 [Rhododendron molle]|uniref:Uncharacterized protein n=1 Tax=Rhododendron molle TaxID=49168 RepID=A0ACC0PK04_RHOML|nr:hypothetical protein RHMOL_Rhmol02G0000300 [Rhododendron molle]